MPVIDEAFSKAQDELQATEIGASTALFPKYLATTIIHALLRHCGLITNRTPFHNALEHILLPLKQ